MWAIVQTLVGRIGVYSRDIGLLDATEFIENLNHRGGIVRGARCIAENKILFAQGFVVDAINHHGDIFFRRGRCKHDFRGPGFKMPPKALPGLEPARSFNDQIHSGIRPGNVFGIFSTGKPRSAFGCNKGVPLHRYGIGKYSVNTVVLQQMRKRIDVGYIIDGPHVYMGFLPEQSEKRTPDTPESVNSQGDTFHIPQAAQRLCPLIYVFVGFVGRAHQRTALHMAETHFQTSLTVLIKFVRGDKSFDRQVFFGGLQVLTYSDNIHSGTP